MKKCLLFICFCTAIPCAQAQQCKVSYGCSVDFAYTTRGFTDNHTFTLETTQGVDIGTRMFAGIQTGVAFNTLTLSGDDEGPGSFIEIPLLADFKYRFLPDAKVRPYADIAAGAMLATERVAQSYFASHLGVGISVRRFEAGTYYQRFGKGAYGGYQNGFTVKLGLRF